MPQASRYAGMPLTGDIIFYEEKKRLLFLAMILGACQSINAGETPPPFKIKAIHVSGPTNFHFRVIADYTDPNAWHCHGGPKNPAWSYINENDPGSKGMMSALLTAYAAQKTITLVTAGVDTPIGHMCRILEFTIAD